MASLTSFDSTKAGLVDLLSGIRAGRIQLPDFQRGWVWDNEHVRSLLASISLSYPIGAVMLLETGNPDVKFKPRLVEGVMLPVPPEPERFILDGQQRLTSLYQSLFAGQPVATFDARGNKIRRWYYIDIEKAINPAFDREDTIIALPEDRITRNFRGEVIDDFSTPDAEYLAGLFPLAQAFDSFEWRSGYNQFWNYAREKSKLWDRFEKEIIQRFEQYQVPVISLLKSNPKEAVCQVFEKVNTGGVSLTVFELLTATFAADDYNLREDWEARSRRLHEHKVLGNVQSDEILQSITLLATRQYRNQAIDAGTPPENAPGISAKRKDVLRLRLADYQNWVNAVTIGFERAARVMQSQKIFSARDLPYRTQLTPLAAILAVLGDRWENDTVRTKLARWYWCGVFGELYGGAVETRFARDLPEVLAWIDGGPEPSTVMEANLPPGRLRSLRSRNSAAYKGVYALLIRDSGLDFRTGEPIDIQIYFDDRIDIHHIFPQKWCRDNGIGAALCDSIVNKTAISARTNRMIGGNAPSIYLDRIQRNYEISEARMDHILHSHVIEPVHLRANDFDSFFRARELALLERIQQAMGKQVVPDITIVQEPEPVEYELESEEVA